MELVRAVLEWGVPAPPGAKRPLGAPDWAFDAASVVAAVAAVVHGASSSQLSETVAACIRADAYALAAQPAERAAAWAAEPQGPRSPLLRFLFGKPEASASAQKKRAREEEQQQEDEEENEEEEDEDVGGESVFEGRKPVADCIRHLTKMERYLLLLRRAASPRCSLEASAFHAVVTMLGLAAAEEFKPRKASGRTVGSGVKPYASAVRDMQVFVVCNAKVVTEPDEWPLRVSERGAWPRFEAYEQEAARLRSRLTEFATLRRQAAEAVRAAWTRLEAARDANDAQAVCAEFEDLQPGFCARQERFKGKGFKGYSEEERGLDGWQPFFAGRVAQREVAVQLVRTMEMLREAASSPGPNVEDVVARIDRLLSRPALTAAWTGGQTYACARRLPRVAGVRGTTGLAVLHVPPATLKPARVDKALTEDLVVQGVFRRGSKEAPLVITCGLSFGQMDGPPHHTREDRAAVERYVPHVVAVAVEATPAALLSSSGASLFAESAEPLPKPTDLLSQLDPFLPFSPDEPAAARGGGGSGVVSALRAYGLARPNPSPAALRAFLAAAEDGGGVAGSTRFEASKYDFLCYFWRFQWDARYFVRLERGADACVVEKGDACCSSLSEALSEAGKPVFLLRCAETPACPAEATAGGWAVVAADAAEARALAPAGAAAQATLLAPGGALVADLTRMGPFFRYVFASRARVSWRLGRALAATPAAATRFREALRFTVSLLSQGREHESGGAGGSGGRFACDMVTELDKWLFSVFPMDNGTARTGPAGHLGKHAHGFVTPLALAGCALVAAPQFRACQAVLTPQQLLMTSVRHGNFPAERSAAVNRNGLEALVCARDVRARIEQKTEAGCQRNSTGRRKKPTNNITMTSEGQPQRKKVRQDLVEPIDPEALFQLFPPANELPPHALPLSSMMPGPNGEAPPHFPALPGVDDTPVFVEGSRAPDGGRRASAAMTYDSRENSTNLSRKAAPQPPPRASQIRQFSGTRRSLVVTAEDLEALGFDQMVAGLR
jgi:hypothetical protein